MYRNKFIVVVDKIKKANDAHFPKIFAFQSFKKDNFPIKKWSPSNCCNIPFSK